MTAAALPESPATARPQEGGALYLRIAHTLAEAIRQGSLARGQRLPSVRETARQYGVALSTVVQAYHWLEDARLVVARPRSGFFVAASRSTQLPEPTVGRVPRRAQPVHVDVLGQRLLGLQDRQALVSFSTTYFVVGTKFVSRKADKLATLQDLKGKTVVATTGSNTVMRLRGIDRKESLNLNLIQAKDFSDSMLTFTSGRADAFFEDDINLVGQISFSLNPADFALSTDTLSRDPYAVMLPRGEPEFKAVADKAIARLFASGEIKALYDKWFQSPIPPRAVNLHFPMSDALAKVIAKPTDSPNPSDY